MIALVTPKVLSWARDSIGYTIDDAAKKIKTEASDIIDWESGKRKPSYAQLEKLAKIYKRPIAVFFFPKPPREESINEKLRALPEEYANSLPPEIHYLVRKAQSRKINLYELYNDSLPSSFQSFSRSFNENKNDAKELANKVRKILGVSTDDQFNWSNTDTALKKWRSKLEEVGIWIFKDNFDKYYSGFCLCDTHIPIVYINNSMSTTRQIFTLFHELAHLLISKGGIDFRNHVESKFTGVYQEDEVFCNVFAGQFLVPNRSIDISNTYSDNQIIEYARKYKVSREVILRKYLDKKIITQDFYVDKVKKWHLDWLKEKERKKQLGDKKTGGPNYYITQKSYLGNKYLSLAFGQYYKNRISEIQLADYLGVKVKSLSGLEGYIRES